MLARGSTPSPRLKPIRQLEDCQPRLCLNARTAKRRIVVRTVTGSTARARQISLVNPPAQLKCISDKDPARSPLAEHVVD